jgi:hypothetical protein
MQPDPEHQEDDPDLRELVRNGRIGDVTRRERPDDDPGHQIADERRYPQPMRQCAKRKRKHQADDNRREQRHVMRHRQRP